MEATRFPTGAPHEGGPKLEQKEQNTWSNTELTEKILINCPSSCDLGTIQIQHSRCFTFKVYIWNVIYVLQPKCPLATWAKSDVPPDWDLWLLLTPFPPVWMLRTDTILRIPLSASNVVFCSYLTSDQEVRTLGWELGSLSLVLAQHWKARDQEEIFHLF